VIEPLCTFLRRIPNIGLRLLWLVVGVAIVVGARLALQGHLLINYTQSIPRGIYWITPNKKPRRGDLVAIPIPEHVRELVIERHYLPRSITLLAKPVAAVGGDHVCVRDDALFINGKLTGRIIESDRMGKPMPVHRACGALSQRQLFLATAHDNSFDSRNFGPVPIENVRGTLTPLMTF
jgi:conjugative transfer signal peptidase TraF